MQGPISFGICPQLACTDRGLSLRRSLWIACPVPLWVLLEGPVVLYWEKVIRIARAMTTLRGLRAIPIMGRDMQSKEDDAATILYPCMQAADIFQMRLDLQCAGIDQRKAHILAREAGGKKGWGKTDNIYNPMLGWIAGRSSTPR